MTSWWYKAAFSGQLARMLGWFSAFEMTIPISPASPLASIHRQNVLYSPDFTTRIHRRKTRFNPRKLSRFYSLQYCSGDGAGDGVRTRDLKLGKLALYQLSYTRIRPAFNRTTLGFVTYFCQELSQVFWLYTASFNQAMLDGHDLLQYD